MAHQRHRLNRDAAEFFPHYRQITFFHLEQCSVGSVPITTDALFQVHVLALLGEDIVLDCSLLRDRRTRGSTIGNRVNRTHDSTTENKIGRVILQPNVTPGEAVYLVRMRDPRARVSPTRAPIELCVVRSVYQELESEGISTYNADVEQRIAERVNGVFAEIQAANERFVAYENQRRNWMWVRGQQLGWRFGVRLIDNLFGNLLRNDGGEEYNLF